MKLSAELDEVLRYMGANSSDPELVERAKNAIRTLNQAITPKYIYQKLNISFVTEGILITDTKVLLPGKDITFHFKYCHACYLLAGTLGAGADRIIRLTSLHSMLDGLALNSAATELTEKLMDAAETDIDEKESKNGNFITSRFSPGYGDLPISLQKNLLTLCDAPRKIGLSATENDILTPKKSVTALIGVSSQPTSGKMKGCAFCNMRKICTFRKAGKTCGS